MVAPNGDVRRDAEALTPEPPEALTRRAAGLRGSPESSGGTGHHRRFEVEELLVPEVQRVGPPLGEYVTPPLDESAWDGIVRRAITRIGPERARLDGGVLDLFRSNHHVVSSDGTVAFSSRVDLPQRGLVILSAAADAKVCKLLFGDRVVVHDVHDVSGVGRIVQHPQSSVSRHWLSKMEPEERERFVAAVGAAPTITYAAFKHLFENPSELHFGNLERRDILGGAI